MPTDDGLGIYKQDGAQEVPEASGQGTYESPLESAPARAFDLAADDDELLAEDQVLGDQGCPGRDEGQDDVEQEAKEGDHDSERLPRRPSWHRADLALRRPRHRRKDRIRFGSRTEHLRPTAGARQEKVLTVLAGGKLEKESAA